MLYCCSSARRYPATLCCALQNPDTQPQAPIDPEVLAAAEANMPQDSVRYMAGKVNQAVGGE
jgi:hypothetical protein